MTQHNEQFETTCCEQPMEKVENIYDMQVHDSTMWVCKKCGSYHNIDHGQLDLEDVANILQKDIKELNQIGE